MPVVTGNTAIRFVAVIAFVAAAVLAAVSGPARAVAPPEAMAGLQQQPAPGQDFAKFSHRTYSHSQLACNSCHQRSDNSIAGKFPGHSACTNCHLSQFTNPQAPMCTLCHVNLASVPPPLKAFPTSFTEGFNVSFDHARHNEGTGRPANGCAACHTGNVRRGVAMSIPVGITAHTTCFQCHSPGATSNFGRDIGGCGSCHAAGGLHRTSTTGVSFNVGFSHATHGARQKLNCADCHTQTAAKGPGQQESSTLPQEHFPTGRGSSCATCHNEKRAFGELADCKKCHSGPTFKVGGR